MYSHERKQGERNHSKHSKQGCLANTDTFSCQASDHCRLGIPMPNWSNRYTQISFPMHTVCKMDTPSFGNPETVIFSILLNYFRESSIFSTAAVFFKWWLQELNIPLCLRWFWGRHRMKQNFGGSLLGQSLERKKTHPYIQACLGRRKI